MALLPTRSTDSEEIKLVPIDGRSVQSPSSFFKGGLPLFMGDYSVWCVMGSHIVVFWHTRPYLSRGPLKACINDEWKQFDKVKELRQRSLISGKSILKSSHLPSSCTFAMAESDNVTIVDGCSCSGVNLILTQVWSVGLRKQIYSTIHLEIYTLEKKERISSVLLEVLSNEAAKTRVAVTPVIIDLHAVIRATPVKLTNQDRKNIIHVILFSFCQAVNA